MYEDKMARKHHFKEQIGTYTLDINKTDLGVYKKDSAIYEKLTITFNKDSTFYFNMKVPFIYDSSGKWISRGNGLDDWDWLYYKNSSIQSQFKGPLDENDSLIYFNGTPSRQGFKGIQGIYFKKIR